MTRFFIGLLIGLLVGIGGTAAFLITARGGDFLVESSPRVRELEGALVQAEKERAWMSKRLDEFTELVTKLESRFAALAGRFELLSETAPATPATPPPSEEKAPRVEHSDRLRSKPTPEPDPET